jgi:lysozyme
MTKTNSILIWIYTFIARFIPEVCALDKVFGIDISHWSGHIDWSQAHQHTSFVIMKATQGITLVDSEYYANKAGCQEYKLSWGAYHFFLPSIDPVEQAEHFVETVGNGCNRYVLDVETGLLEEIYGSEITDITVSRAVRGLFEYPDSLKIKVRKLIDTMIKSNGNVGGPKLLSIADIIKASLDRLEELTGIVPTIYTSPGFWNEFVGYQDWTKDYALWVAHWGVSEPQLPVGWDEYIIHQYGTTGVIPGIPSYTDENYFNGNEQAVLDWFGNGEIKEYPKLVKSSTHFRGMPVCSRPKTGTQHQLYFVARDIVFEALELIPGEDGMDFYRTIVGYIPAWMCEDVEE